MKKKKDGVFFGPILFSHQNGEIPQPFLFSLSDNPIDGQRHYLVCKRMISWTFFEVFVLVLE